MALNPNLIEAKNLLHSSDTWITLMHVDIVDGGGDLRLACNVSNDIIWNGYKWTALPVEVGMIREEKDEVPQVELKISNITQIPQSFAEENDGLISSIISIFEVHSGNLSETDNINEYHLEVTGSSFDVLWAHITLGMNPNPMNKKDPEEKILKNFCRFDFPNSVDVRCPYTGGVFTSCPRTLSACIERNGATVARRYGGYPAVGTNRIYVDS